MSGEAARSSWSWVAGSPHRRMSPIAQTALSEPAALITVRMSSMRVSRVVSVETRSDMPVPRLSRAIRRDRAVTGVRNRATAGFSQFSST
jgi:hypothetical protein